MRKSAIFKDAIFLEHNPGAYHVELPERLAVIYNALDRSEMKEKFLYPFFRPASKEIIGLNHSIAHIARVEATAGRPFGSLDPDTKTSARSYEAALMAAGAVVQAASSLWAGEIENAFTLVRPPGHHAEHQHAMGFCLFNNIAVGAHYALKELGVQRILIVDWDLHHGNGTQNSFYDTDQVLFFSTHQYPFYPGTGSIQEVGIGKGEGYTVNVPLPGGQDDRAYITIFHELLVPIARQYKPELIMVSAGFDIAKGDPLGTMRVTAQGFATLTRILLGLADELCGGRLLLTLEGGYNLDMLKEGVLAVLAEMAGLSEANEIQAALSGNSGQLPLVLEQIKARQSAYWSLQ